MLKRRERQENSYLVSNHSSTLSDNVQFQKILIAHGKSLEIMKGGVGGLLGYLACKPYNVTNSNIKQSPENDYSNFGENICDNITIYPGLPSAVRGVPVSTTS